jgi:hypothetical protein
MQGLIPGKDSPQPTKAKHNVDSRGCNYCTLNGTHCVQEPLFRRNQILENNQVCSFTNFIHKEDKANGNLASKSEWNQN